MPGQSVSRSSSTASTLSRITIVQDDTEHGLDGLDSTPPTSVTDAASNSPTVNAKDATPTTPVRRVRREGVSVSSYNENVLSNSTRGRPRTDAQSPSKAKSLLGKRGREGTGSGLRKSKDKKRRVSRRLLEAEKQKERAASDSPKKQTRQAVAEATQTPEPPKPMPKKPKPTARSKKYLAQGLYVGQDPNHDPRLTEEKNKKKLAAKTQPPPRQRKLLPDPMLAGKRLLELGRGFRLPFNVFSPLPPGQPRPDEWRKTQKNVFVGDAADCWRVSKRTEHSTCMCSESAGCDEHCLNRYMFYECDSNNCNIGPDHCTNRAFDALRHRHKAGGKYNTGVDVIKTADRGYGVRSNRCFEPNQIIMEYTGEIITQDECDDRMRNRYKDNECFYLMMFDQNMIIDATRGSIARFVNHSCEPNCRMEKWTVAGKPRMALFAGEDGIVTGEELTYDYNFDPFSQKNIQECRCGSSQCRGVLGPRSKDKDVRDALKPLADSAATAAGLLAAATSPKKNTKRKRPATAAAAVPAGKKRRTAPIAKTTAKIVVKRRAPASITAARGGITKARARPTKARALPTKRPHAPAAHQLSPSKVAALARVLTVAAADDDDALPSVQLVVPKTASPRKTAVATKPVEKPAKPAAASPARKPAAAAATPKKPPVPAVTVKSGPRVVLAGSARLPGARTKQTTLKFAPVAKA